MDKVTRLEVISSSGREMVKYFPEKTLSTLIQDDGKTLKIILKVPTIPNWKYRNNDFSLNDLRGLAQMEGLPFALWAHPSEVEISAAIFDLIDKGHPFTTKGS